MNARETLEALFRAELSGPVLPGVQRVADAIRARHGDAVVALLFYGSCLRRGVTEGVLDIYAIVDSSGPAPEPGRTNRGPYTLIVAIE